MWRTCWRLVVVDVLKRFIARVLAGVRVNRIERDVRGGVRVVVKRRRFWGSFAIVFGNFFLALSGCRARMFVSSRKWAAWEKRSAELLNAGDEFEVNTSASCVVLPEHPGVSLRGMLRHGVATAAAFSAAGKAIRLAHDCQCGTFEGHWSHGDLHLGNILYDVSTNRAFLIDFDMRHDPDERSEYRRADDLVVLLLELSSCEKGDWRGFARGLLQAYGDADLMEEVSQQLVPPRGFAMILWFTRVSFRPLRQMLPRLATARTIVEEVRAAGRNGVSVTE